MPCSLEKMSKKLCRYLNSRLKGTELREVADIFLFGSVSKGEEFPSDIDICVIFRGKPLEKTMKEIENRLKEFNVHISSLVVDNFFRKPHSLIKSLLVEGESILTGKLFAQNFSLSSYTLYSYDLSNMRQTDKVRFVYLLKGRNSAGAVKRANGEWIADSCFVIPIQKDSEMQAIFNKWNVPYKRKEILMH